MYICQIERIYNRSPDSLEIGIGNGRNNILPLGNLVAI